MKYKIVIKRESVELGECFVECASAEEANAIANEIDLADARLTWYESSSQCEVYEVLPAD